MTWTTIHSHLTIQKNNLSLSFFFFFENFYNQFTEDMNLSVHIPNNYKGINIPNEDETLGGRPLC